MLAESHPLIRRALRLLALPYCYLKLVNWQECTSSKFEVMKDLLFIFFKLKYFPDNYSPCRFWEKDRSEWYYYYGSSYHPYQRCRLRKEVQRFEYIFLFDNKEIAELIGRGIGVNMPRYYGTICPESDYRQKIKAAVLESDNRQIMIKPVMGQGGRDIFLATLQKGKVKIKLGEEEIWLDNFSLPERSIMQEVVQQDTRIAQISSSSVNTVRVITLYTKREETIIISASMRFGVGKAHVDNWCAGGVACGVDHEGGTLMKIAYDKNGRQYVKHPTSGMSFEGFQIPHWDKVVKMAETIQQSCSFFKLIGLDIAILPDGPVLIEINPNPDIIFQEQTAGPLLKNRKTYAEFAKYDLFINHFQKNLYR